MGDFNMNRSYKDFASIYDELIYEDIDYNKIKDFTLQICEEYNVSKENYLDLACGTGNVAIEIAEKFKNRFLVDLSQDMLQEAAEKFRGKRLKANIVCQDMTELSLNRKFDLITCVLDSTNYILEDQDLKSYLKSVKNHLQDDGIFMFDINSFYKLSEILGNNIFTYNSEDVFYTWENIFEDEIVEMNLTFFVKDGDTYRRFDEVHEERAYKEEFIDDCLQTIGFETIGKYEGYSRNVVKQNSERILWVVRKKKE